MVLRFFSYLGLVLIIVAAYCVFAIKHQVAELTSRITEVQRELSQEQDTIYILKAELTYLESPERIKKLAEKYLKLETIKSTQVVESLAETLTDGKPSSKTVLVNPYSSKTVKWRYKKSPYRYMTTVSGRD